MPSRAGRARARPPAWAREEARALSHEHIESEHILLGLLHDADDLAARVLESLGITIAVARPRLLPIEGSGKELAQDEIALSPQAKKVVFLAVSVAVSLGPGDAGAEHILLALAREGALLELGADAERVREEVTARYTPMTCARSPPRPRQREQMRPGCWRPSRSPARQVVAPGRGGTWSVQTSGAAAVRLQAPRLTPWRTTVA